MECQTDNSSLEIFSKCKSHLPLTISRARKILGLAGKKLTDAQIEREIELADFFAELIVRYYKEDGQSYNESRHA